MSERFELSDETFGDPFRVAFAKEIAAEIDVLARRLTACASRRSGSEYLTAPSARLWPRRGLSRAYRAARYTSLVRIAAIADCSSAQSSHLDPFRVVPEPPRGL
jgi:hypothetical protein